MATRTYAVPGVTCGHCKMAIENEVGQVPGVERVEVDIEAKRVAIDGTAEEDAIFAAIAEAGYEVQPV
ncbi:MAG: heavy-metal-associated domain-containing protein [Acidimicrobiales bacterium]